jgi:SAM-dependent methyltransferase
MHIMEEINRRTWKKPLSLRGYKRISGHIDEGERRLFELAFSRYRGGRVLDVGVGGGRTAALLKHHAGDYLGIDYTPEMVAISRANHPDLRFETMDARYLDKIDDGSLDLVVFSYNGIDSVDPAGRLAILAEVNRVLRPGGAFVFSTFHRGWAGFHQAPDRRTAVPSSANPLLLGLRYARYAMGAWRARQHRLHEIRYGEHAIHLHPAHYFGIMVYATTPEQIGRQLGEAGFKVPPAIYDEGGSELGGHLSAATQYFHVFAEKPEFS